MLRCPADLKASDMLWIIPISTTFLRHKLLFSSIAKSCRYSAILMCNHYQPTHAPQHQKAFIHSTEHWPVLRDWQSYDPVHAWKWTHVADNYPLPGWTLNPHHRSSFSNWNRSLPSISNILVSRLSERIEKKDMWIWRQCRYPAENFSEQGTKPVKSRKTYPPSILGLASHFSAKGYVGKVNSLGGREAEEELDHLLAFSILPFCSPMIFLYSMLSCFFIGTPLCTIIQPHLLQKCHFQIRFLIVITNL